MSSDAAEPFDAESVRRKAESLKHLEGALMPILQALQADHGYIDERAVPIVADVLNLTRAEVHGVVSFYHDFRRAPAGLHVVKLCRAEACQAAGGDNLADHVERRLGVPVGETAADGSVTVDAVYCLGLCAVAPAAMFDGRLVGRLDKTRVDVLLDDLSK
ncbi:formate dehydrogenase subunit gamma [Bauldia sp.]|uniref:formate dehydrogenase subunit gamma n=1 Tax=Bauldia sp. TaxID=2575872 RepID=UPI003BA98107